MVSKLLEFLSGTQETKQLSSDWDWDLGLGIENRESKQSQC